MYSNYHYSVGKQLNFIMFNAFTTGNPFFLTNLVEVSIGRYFGALKGYGRGGSPSGPFIFCSGSSGSLARVTQHFVPLRGLLTFS